MIGDPPAGLDGVVEPGPLDFVDHYEICRDGCFRMADFIGCEFYGVGRATADGCRQFWCRPSGGRWFRRRFGIATD